MLDDLKLAFRHQRLEMLMLLGGSIILAAAILILAWRLGIASDALFACTRDAGFDPNFTACRAESELANTLLGASLTIGTAASLVPFFAGVFLGTPLVAGEIEHRTASLAWSLNASRRRWLLRRVAPLGVAFIVGIGVLAFANEILFLTASPDDRIGFGQYGMSGVLLVMRGLGVLAIGIVVGLVVGRVLPAVIVTFLLVIGLVAGLSIGRDMVMRAEAVPVEMDSEGYSDSPVYDSGFRVDETGEFLTWEEAYERYPDEMMSSEDGTVPGTTMIWFVVPSERMPWFVARESGVLGGLVLVAGLIGFSVVGSRRPL